MDKKRIWGLDLGLTSVGWAVVEAGFDKDGKQLNKQGDIIDCGVRIFTAPD